MRTYTSFSYSYKFDTPFEQEIKREVFKIVRRGKEFGTTGYLFRAFSYIAFFFYLQYLWVTGATTYTLAIIYGVSQAFIGLNVQHDANHGAASRRPWVNNLLGLGADFIGGSKWLWMEQHWTVRILERLRIVDCARDMKLTDIAVLNPIASFVHKPP
jgi:fatty acid desaturase (delta-4 desaturase)